MVAIRCEGDVVRTEKRSGIQRNAAGTRFAPVAEGFCSCRERATRRVFNLYREALVCDKAVCVEREAAWVGNTAVIKHKMRSNAPALARRPPPAEPRIVIEKPSRINVPTRALQPARR